MANRYNLRGRRGGRTPTPSVGGTPPASQKLGASQISASPLTPLPSRNALHLQAVEGSPRLYSRVVSPTIPPLELSPAQIETASLASSMNGHGSDLLPSGNQPTMGNHGSGNSSPSGTNSSVNGSSDVSSPVYHDSFEAFSEVQDSNPNPWIHVDYTKYRGRSLASSAVQVNSINKIHLL